GEVDNDVGAIDLARPLVDVHAVPRDDAPCRDARGPAEDDDVVAGPVERAREDRADLTRPARNDDPHARPPLAEPKASCYILVNMFTEKVNTPEVPRGRGRPPGRTPEGTETRKRLFDTAIALM